MNGEEIKQILCEMYRMDCLGRYFAEPSIEKVLNDYAWQAIETICERYKEENQAIDFEWVNIIRIIEKKNNVNAVVAEIDFKDGTNKEFENAFKKWLIEHPEKKSSVFAVKEKICRVKSE